MAWLELTCHPAVPCEVPLRIHAAATRAATAGLCLAYRLEADLGQLRLPAPAAAARADGLWRHTCFEAFVRGEDEHYCELNFAPSGQWAAYRFARYREGMTSLEALPAPAIGLRRGARMLELEVSVAAGALAVPGDAERLRLALTAVIEDSAGRLSYWALAHPPGKPDFHHPDGFRLELRTGEQR